jgi:transposase
MRKRRQIAENIEDVAKAMDTTKCKAEYQRLQCVYLGDTQPDLTAAAIGKIVRLSANRVKIIHSNFRETGMESIRDKRGGRYRENLTVQEERKLLAGYTEESKSGKLIVAGKIKLAYETKLGREVSESTIYRMLDRHGFRKIVPYKRHPKSNKEEQEAFKKTLVK